MSKIEFTYHLKDIDAIASNILEHLESKTILFVGEMGSGKTTFIKALLKAMGSNDVISSPTFSIVNEHKIPNDKVFHFDLYRIESLEEAYDFGIEDYLANDHWLFIEWPERIEELLDDAVTIAITKTDNETRALKLTRYNKFSTEHNAMTEPKF